MEYTKGEWIADFNPGVTGPTTPAPTPLCGGWDWPYRTINVGTETIAIVPAQDKDKAHIPDENAMEANAQLIAAAPDLYEALKFAKPYIAKMIADNVNTAIPPEQAYKRIELALAKAERR